MSGREDDSHRHAALARQSTGVLLTNSLAAIALLATTVLTARAFGPTGRGELSLATQFLALIAIVGGFGLGAAVTYHTAREAWPKGLAFGNSTVLGLAVGIVILTACGCVILLAGATFRGLPEADLFVACLAIPFLLAITNIQSVYQGLRRFRPFNGITLAQAALPLPLIGIAIILGGDVRAAIVAIVAAATALFLAVMAYARRSTEITWRLQPSYVRALVSYGVRAYPANVLGYLGYRLDVFLVDGFKGAAAVGLYGAGVVIAEGLWMPSQAVSTALFPTIAAERIESRRQSITPFVARSTLWLTAILGGVLVAIADPLIQLLYSSRFSASATVVRVLVPGIILFSAARVLGNDIAARGRPLVNSVIAGASVVCNIALNVVLIPRHGIAGAAWASTASYTLLFVATAIVYRRISGVPLLALVAPSRDDAARYMRLFKRSAGRAAADSPGGPERSPEGKSVPIDVTSQRSP